MTEDKDANARIAIRLVQRPPAAVVMQLHKLLGIGASEIARRVKAGSPLLEGPINIARFRVQEVLALIEPFAHDVHLLSPDAVIGPETAITSAALHDVLTREAEPTPTRPVPDAELTEIVAGAAERAIAQLPAVIRSRWCAVALVTTGETLRPYLCVTVHGADLWDLAGSEFAVTGDEHFAAIAPAWDARGMLAELDDGTWEAEFDVRPATLEEALRMLDTRGVFGIGQERASVLLLVATMPPSTNDVGFARRLNPAGPLRDTWFTEAAEGPIFGSKFIPRSAEDERLRSAPNPAMADLWSSSHGVLGTDGTRIYGPDDISERNTTYEVSRYAPGWVLIGDDSGGHGYLMRSTGADFQPATGRTAAEVFQIDLGALTADVASQGTFITDDLLSWLCRNDDR